MGYEAVCVNNRVEQLSVKTGKKVKDKVLCCLNFLLCLAQIRFVDERVLHSVNVVSFTLEISLWLVLVCWNATVCSVLFAGYSN